MCFVESNLDSAYSNLSDPLRKIGTTLYEASVGDLGLDRYFEDAVKYRDLISRTASPHSPPFQRVAYFMSQLFTAEALQLEGRECFAGLVRIVSGDNGILPHHDDLMADLAGHPFRQVLEGTEHGQLAGNLYLSAPPVGGALRLWGRSVPEEQYRITSSDYGLDANLIGPPILSVQPKPGDLVFFDSTKLHDVTPCENGTRVSLSFFLAIAGKDARYWS